MEELRVDMRERDAYDLEIYAKHEELVFKLNHTMPRTEEYNQILKELFEGRIEDGSFLRALLAGMGIRSVKIKRKKITNRRIRTN